MGTTAPGHIHLLELCDQKLLEFVCNVDNKDMVWLEEIEEEAMRMFTRCGQGHAQEAPGAAWLLQPGGHSGHFLAEPARQAGCWGLS